MGRPLKQFKDFIGNRRAVAYAQRLLTGAKRNGEPCPHLLLSAPRGWGKNTFAEALATEYGTTLRTLFPGENTRAWHVCAMLEEMNFGNIFFIDETHSLPLDAQQVLYQAIDEFKIPATESKRINRSTLQSIADFTLVLASNRPGGILKPLRNRVLDLQFDSYSLPELTTIAKAIAIKTGVGHYGATSSTPANAVQSLLVHHVVVQLWLV